MATPSLCVEPRYRLSKPRTSTSTVTSGPLLSRLDSISPISSKQPSPGLEEYPLYHQLRQSIQAEPSDEEDHVATDGPRSVRQRFSRTGTMIAKRASMKLALNPMSRSSTSIARELSAEVESEDEIRHQIQEKAYYDRLAALNQQPPQVTVDEDGYEELIISPIRRRSLYTPGLATRNPHDLLAKPPARNKVQKEIEQDYYYNPRLSESSPLARIAALDLANRPFTPIVRSHTPIDLDYGNLGGPGALRITNGMASPVPSIRSIAMSSHRSLSNIREQSDYFAIHRGHTPVMERSIPFLQEIRRSGEFSSAFKEYAKRQSVELSGFEVSAFAPRHGSSLKYEEEIVSRPEILDSRPISPEFLKQRSKSFPSKPRPDRTSLIAQDYMSELSDNPFEARNKLFTSVEVTSKPNEIEDDLFEECPQSSRSSCKNVQDTDANVGSLENSYVSFEEDIMRELARIGASESAAQTLLARTDLENTRLAHASNSDSGYGSTSSLGSVRKEEPITYGQRSSRSPTRVERARLLEENLTVKPRVVRKPLHNSMELRPPPVTVPTATTAISSVFTRSIQNSSDTIPTVATSQSAATADSKVSIASRRLQKPRPKSQPPPSNRVSIQYHPEIVADEIPPIPLDVAERNARRLMQLPPLDHTLPSVNHEKLLPYELTPVPLSAPVRFPTPTPSLHTPEDNAPQRPARYTQRQSFLGALKPHRRVSHQPAPYQIEAETVATLGDIVHSLGDSPYDIAKHQRVHREARTKPARPTNQMSAYMPRTKSMFGLNDHEAAEVSRLRSQHRSVSLSFEMKKKPLPSPPTTPERKHFNDRGGIPGKMPRLDSATLAQPPLPAIPVSVQVEMRESGSMNYTGAQKVHRPRLHEKRLTAPILTSEANAEEIPASSTLPPSTRDLPTTPKRSSRPDLLSSQTDLIHTRTPSPQNLAIPAGTVARLSGRFEGGLSYGYEPGFGVGGSAGTRSIQSAASRKSVPWGKSYGIDLSDIPIFISPHINQS